jgi:hypothetical protein
MSERKTSKSVRITAYCRGCAEEKAHGSQPVGLGGSLGWRERQCGILQHMFNNAVAK